MEPLQTFLDDPLRILRTIRFATRFNFTIVDEITEAIKQPEIKTALAKKVSFERIGRETDQMLEGENPADSIKYFYDYQIFSHLLKFPETCEELQNEDKVNELTHCSLRVSQILGILFKQIKKQGKFMDIEWPQEDALKEMQKNTFYSGILVPFKDHDYTIKKGKKAKTDKVFSYVMYESLKQPNKGKNFATACLTSLDEFITTVNTQEFDVVQVGTMVKNLGEYLKPTILLSIATEYFRDALMESSAEINPKHLENYIGKYQSYYLRMKEHKVENAHLITPLLNGKDLMKLYEIKGGPVLRTLTDVVFKWQLQNPDGSEDDLKQYLLDNKDNFIQ